MAVNPLSPGVYIDEIQLLPPSVAGVATAVPAFIGYVKKAQKNGVGIPLNTPTRITSLLEYQEMFGGAQGQVFTIDINDVTGPPDQREIIITKGAESEFKMYYNIQMYFANGGGPCWVVPVGLYSTATGVLPGDLTTGLDATAKVDEPTLLVFPDAISMGITDSKTVYDAALTQCELLKDRFVIMDVLQTTGVPNTDASDFRTNGIGTDNLKYGATYYPYLDTSLNFGLNLNTLSIANYTIDSSPVSDLPATITFMDYVNLALSETQDAINFALIAQQTLSSDDANTCLSLTNTAATEVNNAATEPGILSQFATPAQATMVSIDSTEAAAAVAAATSFTGAGNQTPSNAVALLQALNNLLAALQVASAEVTTALNLPASAGFVAGSLAYLQLNNPAVYASIIAEINSYRITLNPSGTMAGIYARVDRQSGVWKAPANVGITNIVGPSIMITNSQQDGLNVDATSGKSINALRAFTGRGTVVWGGRTLAGNDNEWRYVNVRRLFIYVEESIQEATQFVVFESNTANTWQKVRGLIESFLTGLWRDGALAGATTQDAYFVRVGLGTTMTAQDILEGRMIVEVGLAAVRPAEFIILKFMHKLQES